MELFTQICHLYHLGELTEPPAPLTGGLMHRMYSLFTTKGKYAVKLLNPHVMKRDTAKENFRLAEELEFLLEQHSLPILPALIFNGQKMQELNGQFFYLFDWYDGKSLKGKEITAFHCREIGKVLAAIHKVNQKEVPYRREEIHIDWTFYAKQIQIEAPDIYPLLQSALSLLYESQEKGNLAIKKMPPLVTVCHNDMDSKNILWKDDNYRIIDLECLSYASPFPEMYELALCWSGYEECNVNFELFQTFVNAYLDAGGFALPDPEILYYSNYGRLEWLEYNLKRVLGIESDSSEKEMGISEVITTLKHVVYYDQIKDMILNQDFLSKDLL